MHQAKSVSVFFFNTNQTKQIKRRQKMKSSKWAHPFPSLSLPNKFTVDIDKRKTQSDAHYATKGYGLWIKAVSDVCEYQNKAKHEKIFQRWNIQRWKAQALTEISNPYVVWTKFILQTVLNNKYLV